MRIGVRARRTGVSERSLRYCGTPTMALPGSPPRLVAELAEERNRIDRMITELANSRDVLDEVINTASEQDRRRA